MTSAKLEAWVHAISEAIFLGLLTTCIVICVTDADQASNMVKMALSVLKFEIGIELVSAIGLFVVDRRDILTYEYDEKRDARLKQKAAEKAITWSYWISLLLSVVFLYLLSQQFELFEAGLGMVSETFRGFIIVSAISICLILSTIPNFLKSVLYLFYDVIDPWAC